MKRAFGFCMMFCLFALIFAGGLLLFSQPACAESCGTCGNNLTWVLDDEGTLIIRGTGAMTNYFSWSNLPWGTEIQACVIEEGVTSIGNYVFSGCSSLTSITIPDSVTSIGHSAFSGCHSLTSITIPDSVTVIGNGAFSGCFSLTSITIPNSVTSIGNSAFDYCIILTSITIPDGVTSIGKYAFSGCSSLTSITIPDSVTVIGNNAFYNCSSLTSITIPDSVTSIGKYAFSGCSSLTSITIPESVTSIGDGAISGCSKICFLGESIAFGENVSTDRTTVYCYKFTDIDSWAMDKNYDIVYLDALDMDNNLTWVLDDEGTLIIRGTGAMTNYFSWSNLPWGTEIQACVIEEGVTSIGNYVFSGCSSLTSITIPDSVTSIGHSAFSGCSSLTSITIPDSVTSIGIYAFSGCSGLTSIMIPESLTSIRKGAFQYCSSLTSIAIPDGVTSIGDYAFTVCSSLTSITIPESVTSIGNYAFRNCSSLTGITIPEGVTRIGNNVFDSCSSLMSITIPESVTSIGDGTFKWCSNLNKVCFLGDSITFGENVFTDRPTLYCYIFTDIDSWAMDKNYDIVYLDALDMDSVRTVTLAEDFCLRMGETQRIAYSIFPDDRPEITWTCSDPSIASVSGGIVIGLKPGTATITATAASGVSASCEVTVLELHVLNLPANLTAIESEALAGLSKADAVRIPAGVTEIADDAFLGSDVILYAPAGSYGATWAKAHGYPVIEE